MTWPWPEGESWRVSGTHHAITNGVWSSLDMLDGKGTCDWKVDHSCTEDTPLVYSMFTGTVRSISKCQLTIVHSTGWGIKYYHMDKIMVKPQENVKRNQPIGRYAGDYKTALCHGGVTIKPHLHIDLMNPSGSFTSFDGQIINGYKIKAGIIDYDTDCSRTYFEKNNNKYCPSGYGVDGDKILNSNEKSKKRDGTSPSG